MHPAANNDHAVMVLERPGLPHSVFPEQLKHCYLRGQLNAECAEDAEIFRIG